MEKVRLRLGLHEVLKNATVPLLLSSFLTNISLPLIRAYSFCIFRLPIRVLEARGIFTVVGAL